MCFGDLLVINKWKYKRKNNIVWECECKCGNKCTVSSTLLRDGKIDKCKGCEYNLHIKEKIRAKNGRARNTWWTKFTGDAFLRGKKVLITVEYTDKLFDKQKGRCCLSGLEIELPKVVSGKKKWKCISRSYR